MEARLLSGRERSKILLGNVIVIVLLGLLAGLYSKYDGRAQRAVSLVHEMLQDRSDSIPVPLTRTEGFTEHRGQPYTLSQVDSVYSTVGVDVTAHYEDGYRVMCTVIQYEEDQEPRMNPCKGYLP
jgi:hypothetical protein